MYGLRTGLSHIVAGVSRAVGEKKQDGATSMQRENPAKLMSVDRVHRREVFNKLVGGSVGWRCNALNE